MHEYSRDGLFLRLGNPVRPVEMGSPTGLYDNKFSSLTSIRRAACIMSVTHGMNRAGRVAEHRKQQLCTGPGVSVTLSHYAPGSAMGAHAHDRHQVSLLLAGELEETSGRHACDLNGPSLGFKAAGRDHADRYGPNGALILSVKLDDEHDELAVRAGWQWKPAVRSDISLARAIVAGPGAADMLELAADLAAFGGTDETPAREDRPSWALALRDRLREEAGPVDLDAAARAAGVHRGHVSRGFRRCFGMPPSLYGLRCRLARAISHVARDMPGSQAAHEAGFADQSHFIRTLKRETGFTPEALRAAMAAG